MLTCRLDDVPDGFALAAQIADRTDAAAFGIGFTETVNTVFLGTLAGRVRCPQHRREDGIQRCQIPHHAARDEAIQERHFAIVQQRADDFPVPCVPARRAELFGGAESVPQSQLVSTSLASAANADESRRRRHSATPPAPSGISAKEDGSGKAAAEVCPTRIELTESS